MAILTPSGIGKVKVPQKVVITVLVELQNKEAGLKSKILSLHLTITLTKTQITSGGMEGHYNFAQLHFHWGTVHTIGSEHTVSEESYPMEVRSIITLVNP